MRKFEEGVGFPPVRTGPVTVLKNEEERGWRYKNQNAKSLQKNIP
jgi:hypothetical protein